MNLSTLDFFKDIPPDLLEMFLAECTTLRLRPDDILLSPDQENQNLYLLVTGQLQVYLDKAESQVGFPIKPGDCIGEMSIIEGTLTSALVTAERESSLIVISADLFWGKFIQLPYAVRNLLQLLIHRMRKDNERIRHSLIQQLKYEHIQRELESAGKIQANILPPGSSLFPHHPQVDVWAMMEPAKEVGGDFYDAFAVDTETICVMVGDVSGKGMPAALFMVRAMTLLRMSLTKRTPFSTVLPTVNRLLCENNDEFMFVTLFVGLLEVRTGRLQYANGGHNPPFISNGEGSYDLLDLPEGMLLGVHETADYGVAEYTLQPNDTLILYTDGVTEAENSAQEQFSVEYTRQILSQTIPNDDTSRVVNRVHEAVLDFADGVPQSDDITLLALRYLGSATSE